METVGAIEVETHLAELLDRVERGESLIITRAGKPVARLVPSVSFASSGVVKELPSWVFPVFQSLAERWGHGTGWDGYNAKPTNDRHVQTLLGCLSLVLPDKGAAPVVVPLSDGGVQAEWHKSDSVLEVVVADDEPPRFYYYDADNQKEDSGPFRNSIGKVRQLIELF